MGDTLRLFLDLLISTVGMSYFVYGKKAGHLVALLSGIILMGYSYFVPNVWLMVLLGGGLMAAPFCIDLGE